MYKFFSFIAKAIIYQKLSSVKAQKRPIPTGLNQASFFLVIGT